MDVCNGSGDWLNQLVKGMEKIDTNDTNNEVKSDEPKTTAEVNVNIESETTIKPKDNDMDIAIEALNHFNQGKRHLLVEDYSSAVLSLQESCQLFDKRFGIGAEECGEAYLYYGTALLELARLEDGIFDGVVHTKLAEISEAEDEEEEEEEEEEDSQEETENTEEKVEDKKTDTEEDIEDSDEEKKKKNLENKMESESEVKPESSVDTNVECLPSTSKCESNEGNDDNQEDDASNIEVSWEVLSLAKNVFLKHIDRNDNKLKLAETLQKLGEISIEWENNKNAIEILTESLNYRKELLPEDDRLIAETYYHLGIAFSFNNDNENANNCFQSAIQVIETRIGNQKQKLKSISADDIESIATVEREIKQLENVLPDMKSKIEDSKEQLLNVKEALQREQTERTEEDTIAVKNQQLKDKPITDISHLIKRKRQNSGPETTPKKICSNGNNVIDNGKTSEETVANI